MSDIKQLSREAVSKLADKINTAIWYADRRGYLAIIESVLTNSDLFREGSQSGTYSMPGDGWTCFHCGEKFTTIGSAQDHFGGQQGRLAGCQIKADDERGLLMELRKAETSRDEWMDQTLRGRDEIEMLEGRVGSLTTAMQSYAPFRECHSISDVFFVFNSTEGRAIAAEEKATTAFREGYELAKEDAAMVATDALPIGADNCASCEKLRVISARIFALTPDRKG